MARRLSCAHGSFFIEDADEKFDEKVAVEALAEADQDGEGDEEESSDDECCGRPAADEFAEQNDEAECECDRSDGPDRQDGHESKQAADADRKPVDRLQLGLIDPKFEIPPDLGFHVFVRRHLIPPSPAPLRACPAPR